MRICQFPVAVGCEKSRCLPSTAGLGRTNIKTFLLADRHGGVQTRGIEHGPETRWSQPIFREGLPVMIDDYLELATSTHIFEPFVGRGLIAVGDCYAMNIGILLGRFPKLNQQFLGVYNVRISVIILRVMKTPTWATTMSQKCHHNCLMILPRQRDLWCGGCCVAHLRDSLDFMLRLLERIPRRELLLECHSRQNLYVDKGREQDVSWWKNILYL